MDASVQRRSALNASPAAASARPRARGVENQREVGRSRRLASCSSAHAFAAKNEAETPRRSSVGDDRRRGVVLALLGEISAFTARKELGARLAAPNEWRSLRRKIDNNLFEVVLHVCEDRMRRLQQQQPNASTSIDRSEWSSLPPRMLVAEAMVQELLVSLLEVRLKEKEELVMDEVENVETMRQLYSQLAMDEQAVRRQVCASAGDDEQLRELQSLLRTDFLSEMPRGHLGTPELAAHDSISNNDASLQFAWETIHEQKKEIVRLRAEVDEFRQRNSDRPLGLSHSLFCDDPKKESPSIDLLRSQISSHHDNNVAMLHEHIQNLEKALHRATSSPGSVLKASKRALSQFDASSTTVDSSRDRDSSNDFSRSFSSRVSATDFSQTATTSRIKSCDQCHRKSISILTLEAETRQLRAQLAADQEALVMAEKGQAALKSENLALTTEIVITKQSQKDLQKLVIELRVEKTQLQEIMTSYRQASEATTTHLQSKIAMLEKAQQQHLSPRSIVEPSKSFVSGPETELRKSYLTRLSALENAVHEMKSGAREPEANASVIQDNQQLGSEILTRGPHNTRAPSPVSNFKSMDKLRGVEVELGEARRLIARMEAEKRDLQRAFAELESELIRRDELTLKLQTSLENAKTAKSELMTAFEDAKDKSRLGERERDKLQSNLDTLKLELRTTRDAISNITSELEETRDRLSITETRLKEADASNEIHKSELQRLTKIATDAEVTRTQYTNLKVEHQRLLEDLEVKNQESNKKARQAEELNSLLKQEIADTKTTVLMWMSKYNSAQESNIKIEEELASVREETYALTRQLEESAVRHDVAISSLRTELKAQFELDANKSIRTANETLAAASQTVAERYHSRIEQLENQNEVLKLQIAKQESEIQALSVVDEKRKKTLMLVESASQQLNEEARASKVERQQIQLQLATSERERSTLKLLVETLEARPQLQKRALMEMISRSFRELENVSLVQLSEHVDWLQNRLESLYQHQNQLLSALSSTSKTSLREATSNLPPDNSSRYKTACQVVRELGVQSNIPAIQSFFIGNAEVDLVALIPYLFSCAAQIYSDHRFSKLSIEDLPPTARGKLSKPNDSQNLEQPSVSGVAVTFAESGSSWFGPVSPVNSIRTVTNETISAWNKQKHSRSDAIIRWEGIVGRLIRDQRAINVISTFKKAAMKWKSDSQRWATIARFWSWRYTSCAIAAAATSRRMKVTQDQKNECELAIVRLKSMIHSAEMQSKLNKAVEFQCKQSLRHWQLKALLFSWRFHTALHKLAKRLEASEADRQSESSAFTPETTRILGNCIYLLQQFCGDGVNTDATRRQLREDAVLGKATKAPIYTRESLISMLETSNHKIAGWQVVLDKKMSELDDSKQRLRKLNSRCSELNDLVSLNQRLIAEMERRLSAREHIVEAAWEVANAFQQLSHEKLLSQGDKNFREMIVACDSLIDALHSFRVSRQSRSIGAAKAKLLAQSMRIRGNEPSSGDAKRVTFASSQNALGPSRPSESKTSQSVEVNSLSISMLEDAVISLRSVGKNRERLDKALADTSSLLKRTQSELRRRNLQFHTMRAFIQWKCVTLTLRLRAQNSEWK